MDFTPRLRDTEKGREIFDPVRKKYVALTPEEWVRQQLVHFLMIEQQVPVSLIGVEVVIPLNRRNLRADVIVYGRSGQPLLLAECKAGDVKITSKTFMQVAGYNLTWRVPWLIVSNGIQLYCCMFNAATGQYDFVDKVPVYGEMNKEES
ncbi:MAG: type I restriction enzyme HsdR N-terminal domain-containing protein [Prevotellaceae bacterium]|jgi:predicted type IV restriction endonuclease|nr:type I restriction enzyme HsdR N-terminal domain-containing protein [Prevotellaceae bacterium]